MTGVQTCALPISNPVTGTGTSNQIAYFPTSSTVGSLTTSTYPSLTELSYAKGVTSAIQTQLDAKSSSDEYLTGGWNIPSMSTYSSTPNWAGTAWFTPFIVRRNTVFTEIGCSLSAGVAGGSARLGIYNNNINQPSTVVYQSGTIDCSTAGFKSEVFSQVLTLQPGIYWRVGQVSSNTISIRNGFANIIIPNNTDSNLCNVRTISRTYSAFTDNPSTSFNNPLYSLCVFLKVQ